ncbi:hypothetical protein ACFP1Z_27860 [Streptomyces gamaensis]|uniref:Universal stress protein n=1 Tax=Streptomyces gamaensis TaxID=1763542 RepID=A0ABW0Z7S5_9ACTN
MIVGIGHADLNPATAGLLEDELSARLRRAGGDGAAGLVRAGAGLPVVFGRAVRRARRRLVVVLPAQGVVPAPLSARERTATRELLVMAEHVHLLTCDPGDRDACVTADEGIIASSRRVLAVWDGSPSNGRDATAHLVAYARARGIPVDVVWPKGAGRG